MPASVREFEATGKASVEGDNWDHSLKSLEAGFRKYALAPVFGSVSAFCRHTEGIHANAQAEMVQALRTNPFNSGYAVSCFHDLAIWYCGITNIFRDPKPVSRRLAAVNEPLFPAIEAEPSPAWTNRELTIRCILVNENVLNGPAKLFVTVTSPAGEKVIEETKDIDLAPEDCFVAPVYEKRATLNGPSGHYVIRATVEGSNGHKASNERRLFALDPHDIHWPGQPILLFDLANHLVPFFARQNVSYELWSTHTEVKGRPILIGDMAKWYYYEHTAAVLGEMRLILAAGRTGSTVGFLFESSDGLLINLINDLGIQRGPLRLVDSAGNFRGDFHYVKPHALFRGLPVKQCMGGEYRNVVGRISMDGFEGETVAGCSENAYWWGTDVGVMKTGSGAVVLSTMRLSQNLGADPVADIVLSNISSFKPG